MKNVSVSCLYEKYMTSYDRQQYGNGGLRCRFHQPVAQGLYPSYPPQIGNRINIRFFLKKIYFYFYFNRDDVHITFDV